MYDYEYEQELEDGSLVYWTLMYDIEPGTRGGRDEPPSRGHAILNRILHEDGSALPDDSWEAAGFGKEKIEEMLWVSWVDVHSGPDDDDSDWRERA